MSDCSFSQHVFDIHQSGVLTALFACCMAQAAWNHCCLGTFCVHRTTLHLSGHFMQSHIQRVHACLAVTCHLHFWRNDGDLVCATAVTQRWNRYQNTSQHRKMTLEKKKCPLPGLKPTSCQSQVRHSNRWAIPTPPSDKIRDFFVCMLMQCNARRLLASCSVQWPAAV